MKDRMMMKLIAEATSNCGSAIDWRVPCPQASSTKFLVTDNLGLLVVCVRSKLAAIGRPMVYVAWAKHARRGCILHFVKLAIVVPLNSARSNFKIRSESGFLRFASLEDIPHGLTNGILLLQEDEKFGKGQEIPGIVILSFGNKLCPFQSKIRKLFSYHVINGFWFVE